MIVKISDISQSLRKIKSSGKYFELYKTGLQSLDEIYKVVKGYPLFIGGHVSNGKSEFTLELAVSLANNYGFKFACYLGESGKTEIAMIEICQKIIGKNYFEFSDSDVIYSEQFIEKHFHLFEIDDLTIKGFYDEVEQAEKDLGINFDGTILDPFNDVSDGTASSGGRTDIWLAKDLKYVRNVSKKFNRIDIVVFHIQDIKPIQDKESGVWYSRPALPTEWAGGQVVNRRAFTQLFVFIIPEWMKDENGVPHGKNKVMIINQKPKPKGTGKKGNAIFSWDYKKNRYFEEINGMKKYMIDKPTQQIKPSFPNIDFDNLINDKEPF